MDNTIKALAQVSWIASKLVVTKTDADNARAVYNTLAFDTTTMEDSGMSTASVDAPEPTS